MTEISQIVNYLKKINTNLVEKNNKSKIHNPAISRNLKFIEKNEYLIERGLVSKRLLINIKRKLRKNMVPKNIFRPKDTSILNKKNFEEIYTKNRNLEFWAKYPKISNSDYSKGLKTWKKKSNYVVVKNPEKICPELKKIKKIKEVKKITDFYYSNLKYKHVHTKVIYSFKNKKYPIDIQVFHNDLDGAKVLKLFIYLNDVRSINDGPTQFIVDSNIFDDKHKTKLKNWKLRMLNKGKDKNFRKNKVFSFLGNIGDGFFLKTGVYHKGSIPKKQDRILLILTFNCHEELITGKYKKNKI